MDVTRAIRRLHLRTIHCEEDSPQLAEEIAGLLDGMPALERRAVIRHAYWRMPEVPTKALQMAVGGAATLRELAGRGPVIGGCGRCGRILRAQDRDLLDEETPTTCGACEPAAQVAAPDRPRPQARAAFDWEFHATPQPWRSRAESLTATQRSWAEQYPDGTCA